MNTAELHCTNCGHTNSRFRFWCEGCRAPLPQPAQQRSSDASGQQELKRKQLYDRVLADLEQLVQSHEVLQDKTDPIRTFYRMQLNQIAHREAERSTALSIDKVVCSARIAAQAGRYEQAIESLRLLDQQHAGVIPFETMSREIHAREVQERTASEVDKLLDLAQKCLRQGQVDQAHQQLSRALELAPGNRAVRDALVTVKPRIAAERAAVETINVKTADDAKEKRGIDRQVEEHVTASAPKREAGSDAVGSTELESAVPRTSTSGRSFAVEEEEVPSATQRLIDSASQWSTVLKPFLLDNVGWFVGAFLVIAGFVVLIVSFWGSIEQNQILMHSLVYLSLATTTGMFFAMAYFMRLKYPQLENSSNVLLVIVALLIPLVFAAAVLTTLVPGVSNEIVSQASLR